MARLVPFIVCGVALVAGSGALAGTSGTTRPDLLIGDKGPDWIHGGGGDDAVYGLAGPGQDTMVGRWGNDRIYVCDGQRDFVHCGAGYDVVIADNVDVIDVTCDKVVYPKKT